MKHPLPLRLSFVALLLLAGPAVAQDAPPEETAPVPAEEPAAEPAEPAEPAEERISFDVRLGAERGGGRVIGTAGDFEYQDGQYLLATGGVEIKYQSLELEAERARIDIPSNFLTAEGDVVLDDGPQRLVGDVLEYDLDTRTGKVSDATAYVEGQYSFSGSRIAKIGAETFTVDDGVFTSCTQDVPSWSIAMSGARITVDEYAHIRNARLKFKKVPVFYAPYILWPATTDRATGFLVPKPGSSKRRGAELSLAYYKTLGRSADATFVFDLSSKEYFGFGNEVRYRPSERTDGYFRTYILSEPDNLSESDRMIFFPGREPDTRWKVELVHETKDLWNGFRGVVSVREYSDFEYLRDFERDLGRQRQSVIYSTAFLTRNYGQQSLNILVDQRERFLSATGVDTRRQLPEIEYSLRPTPLGNTPLYLSLQSAVHFLSIDRNNLSGEYGRANLAPNLSIPLSTLPWLSAKVNAGGRATFYSDTPGQATADFDGGTLTRVSPQAGLEVIGPSFSRIFDLRGGGKLKHIIEPRVDYAFTDDFNRQDEIFIFDEIDNLRPINSLRFQFINRFLAKPAADSGGGGAVEVASISLAQDLSLDDTRPGQFSRTDPLIKTDEGPLFLSLRVNPRRDASVRSDLAYNTLFSQLQSFALTGNWSFGRQDVGLTWRSNWNAETGDKTSEQARISARLELIPNKLTFATGLSFDVLGPLAADGSGARDAWDLLQQRYFLNWQGECLSWQLEFRESRFGVINPIEDRDVRFALTLKNVGTFLDLNDSF